MSRSYKTLNIPTEMHEHLATQAKRHGRTIIGHLSVLLREDYLQVKKDEWKPKPNDVYTREKYVPNP